MNHNLRVYSVLIVSIILKVDIIVAVRTELRDTVVRGPELVNTPSFAFVLKSAVYNITVVLIARVKSVLMGEVVVVVNEPAILKE